MSDLRASLLRPGFLFPRLLLAVVLLDVGARAVPLRRLSFRPYERLLVYAHGAAPFLTARRVEMGTIGDLANLGGAWFPVDRRRETFTTDAAGFRNSGNVAGPGPVGVVLFGDSFVVGVGLRDDETLAARLAVAAGFRVFNAGGTGGALPAGVSGVLEHAGLAPGGWVVVGASGLEELPTAPSFTGVLPRPVASPPTWEEQSLHVSRLGILSRRLGAFLGGLARVEPGSDVVRRRLANGDSMLFLTRRPVTDGGIRATAAESWVRLQRELAGRGFGLLVLLVPAKEAVYAGAVTEPMPFRPSAAASRIAAALSGRGVPVLDLGPALGAAAATGLPERRYVYWRDDTHWNPEGVRIAADALARALAAAGTPRGAADEPAASIPQRSAQR